MAQESEAARAGKSGLSTRMPGSDQKLKNETSGKGPSDADSGKKSAGDGPSSNGPSEDISTSEATLQAALWVSSIDREETFERVTHKLPHLRM